MDIGKLELPSLKSIQNIEVTPPKFENNSPCRRHFEDIPDYPDHPYGLKNCILSYNWI